MDASLIVVFRIVMSVGASAFTVRRCLRVIAMHGRMYCERATRREPRERERGTCVREREREDD